jgi:hypothetical protein
MAQAHAAESAPSAASPAASAFAKSILIGMQLSVHKGLQQGQTPAAVDACVQALDASSFDSVFQSYLSKNLSASELQDADAFFATTPGMKLAQHGQMQVYLDAGEKAPEPMPTFSDTDNRVIDTFNHTAAGEKLFASNLLGNPAAQQVIRSRITELLTGCNPKP